MSPKRDKKKKREKRVKKQMNHLRNLSTSERVQRAKREDREIGQVASVLMRAVPRTPEATCTPRPILERRTLPDGSYRIKGPESTSTIRKLSEEEARASERTWALVPSGSEHLTTTVKE